MGAFSPFSPAGSGDDFDGSNGRGSFPKKKPAAKPGVAAAPASPALPSSYSFRVSDEQIRKLRGILQERGYTFKEVPYTVFGAQKDKLTVNAYTSGKLLVQGKGAKEFVEFIIEPEIMGEAKLGYTEVHNPEMFEPHLGIDESGKGDFFGPLVIAGVYTKKSTARRLLDMGVRDSKTIGSDSKAEEMADLIKEVVGPNGWKVLPMSPEKYNQLYGKFRNLNRMLAWAHATVIEDLLTVIPDCPRALSDQFADPTLIQKALKEKGKGIVMEQRTKAESDIAVAAASILARAEFIRRLRMLGEGAGTVLPKGASSLTKATAKRIATEKGSDGLRLLCKAHFKTFYEATGVMDPTMRPGALEDSKKSQEFWAEKRRAYKNKPSVAGPGIPATPTASGVGLKSTDLKGTLKSAVLPPASAPASAAVSLPAPIPTPKVPTPKSKSVAAVPPVACVASVVDSAGAATKSKVTKKTSVAPTASAPLVPPVMAPPSAPVASAPVPPKKPAAKRKPTKKKGEGTAEFEF
ncbi:MAG: ribonuclease HIII [Candidatus Methylacidiphilales bacterium]